MCRSNPIQNTLSDHKHLFFLMVGNWQKHSAICILSLVKFCASALSAVRQTLQIQISPFPEERWFSKKSWVWTNVEIQLLVYSRRFRKYFGDHGWKRLKKAVENIKQIWFHLFLYMYVAFRKPLLTVYCIHAVGHFIKILLYCTYN